jgi:hypothetical protein
MLSVPGVVPPDGVTESQVPPWGAAVKVSGEPLLVTRMFFAEGLAWPDW